MSTFVIHTDKEQEKIVKAFLEALDISFEKDEDKPLPQHVLDGIARGLEDYEAGRYITFDAFKKKYPAK